jgi:hypothetical protein
MHATGIELERMVLGGSPEGHRREAVRSRRSTGDGTDAVAATSAPVTTETVLTHPPRPRKKKRR